MIKKRKSPYANIKLLRVIVNKDARQHALGKPTYEENIQILVKVIVVLCGEAELWPPTTQTICSTVAYIKTVYMMPVCISVTHNDTHSFSWLAYLCPVSYSFFYFSDVFKVMEL